MNNKNIIIAGAIAVGLYLFSQTKKTAQRIRPTATSSIKQRTAQKIGKIIGKKVAQKVDISKMPVAQIRDMIAHAAAQKKTGKEVAALKAEEARRVARANAAYKAAQKRIGMSISRTAYIAARRKAAARKAVVRKAAAQKIGKKIGKMVAQKIKTRRAVMARYAARQRPQIQRPNPYKKRAASWKAPYRFPNKKFQVITPSDILKNLVKKHISRKKAVQQKKAQKTTPSTPSDRRKSRLKALYGSHWHSVWLKRQKRG